MRNATTRALPSPESKALRPLLRRIYAVFPDPPRGMCAPLGTHRTTSNPPTVMPCHVHRCTEGPAPRCHRGGSVDRPVANAVASARAERTPDERRHQRLSGRGPRGARGRHRPGLGNWPPLPATCTTSSVRPISPATPTPTPLGGAPAGGWWSPPAVCTVPPGSCRTPPTSSSGWPPGGPTPARCRGAHARSRARRCGPAPRVIDAEGDWLELCDATPSTPHPHHRRHGEPAVLTAPKRSDQTQLWSGCLAARAGPEVARRSA